MVYSLEFEALFIKRHARPKVTASDFLRVRSKLMFCLDSNKNFQKTCNGLFLVII